MTTQEEIVETLKTIIDPEIFLDIWTLGLIYGCELQGETVHVKMTFTSMACPAGPELAQEVKDKLGKLPGVSAVEVEVVFDPPWAPSEELKAMLGIA